MMLDELLGVRLSLLIGTGVPLPAGPEVVDALESLQVRTDAGGQSGFQAVFRLGRELAPDFSLLVGNRLGPFTRVVATIVVGAWPTILIDGVITHQQVTADSEPGASRLTVSGRDLTALMDLEERSAPAPNQPDGVRVRMALARYAKDGIIPVVTDTTDVPLEIDRIPQQNETDLALIRRLATTNGFVFRLDPVAPAVVNAYWGPEVRLGLPQPALAVGQGAGANIDSLDVSVDSLAPVGSSTTVVDPFLKLSIPVPPLPSLKLPPLARQPLPVRRTRIQRDAGGKSIGQALIGSAAEATNAPSGVTASGTVDAARYGHVLKPGQLVGVRGAGESNDGHWHVDSVSHSIRPGSYTQSFTLSRDGTGTLTPVVLP
jgi:hypothetical protein